MNKLIYKTYKFRLYPTKDQKDLLSNHFGATRWVYNHFLDERIIHYKLLQNKFSISFDDKHFLNESINDINQINISLIENMCNEYINLNPNHILNTDIIIDSSLKDCLNVNHINYYSQCSELVELKKLEKTKWLNEINAQSLQSALLNLDNAYKNFFTGTSKFPNFKKKNGRNSFTVPQGGRIENNKLSIPKFREGIKIKMDRTVNGKICKMTITKTKTNKYYVSILTEQECEDLPKTGKLIGIDLGLKDFIVASDGERFLNNKYLKKYEKKLKHEQRALSRKQKGSRGYESQRIRVAKVHEKIHNSRIDMQQKVSTYLVQNNDFIAVEDLNIEGMMKNRKLSKQIADVGWSSFINMLSYKCDWYGKTLVSIDRFYPSSKTCSNCGCINQNLKLSDREWTCKSCGSVLDRDLNAAINILHEGLKISTAGIAVNADGGPYQSSTKKKAPVKSETQLVGCATIK